MRTPGDGAGDVPGAIRVLRPGRRGVARRTWRAIFAGIICGMGRAIRRIRHARLAVHPGRRAGETGYHRSLYQLIAHPADGEDYCGFLSGASAGKEQMGARLFLYPSHLVADWGCRRWSARSIGSRSLLRHGNMIAAARRFQLNPEMIYGFDRDRIAAHLARINLLLAYPGREFTPGELPGFTGGTGNRRLALCRQQPAAPHRCHRDRSTVGSLSPGHRLRSRCGGHPLRGNLFAVSGEVAHAAA